jgi:hypothetical protein
MGEKRRSARRPHMTGVQKRLARQRSQFQQEGRGAIFISSFHLTRINRPDLVA